MSSCTTALIGDPSCLLWAYPDSLRAEISRRVSLVAMDRWQVQGHLARNVEIILSSWGMPRMDQEFLDHFPKLRAVFYAAGEATYFVTSASRDRGIVVSNAKQANAIPVAEYTTSVALLSLKRFWHFMRQTHRTKVWKWEIGDAIGSYQATVGLLSLGAVGRKVAQMLSHHEIKLIGYDPHLNQEHADEIGVHLVSLEELFSCSDVLTVHAPHLPETVNLVDASLLQRMKPYATFINTSRGAVVNQDDLISVLRQRPDMTAVLDVTWPEPPETDSPLYALENVILTPHIAGSLGNEVTRLGRWMVDDMYRFLDGRPLKHQHFSPESLANIA